MDAEKLLQALGRVIREKRQEQGYSQESFAEEVGVHRTYMGAIERGEQNIAFKNLCRIANSLKTTLSILLKEAEKV